MVSLLSSVLNFHFAAKLLVVSGVDSGNNYVTQSEVIDLANSSKVCQPWADHPKGTKLAAGALVDNQVMLCGGMTPEDDYSTNCHLISPNTTEAVVSLNIGSSYSAAIEFQEKLLLSGGYGDDRAKFGDLNRTEFINLTQTYPGPDLPYPVYGHCLIKTSSDDFMLTGGRNING